MNVDELKELRNLVEEMRADRAAAKDKERREAWTKYTSLSLVFLAVSAAISTQYGGRYSNQTLSHLTNATYFQTQASDQWSYFQAKSIKGTLYQVEKDALAATAPAAGTPAAALLQNFTENQARYDKEKADIKQDAEKLEKQRDGARENATQTSHRGGEMGLATSAFQIAIALGSLCLLTKRRWLWFLSLAVGAGALAQMVYAWML